MSGIAACASVLFLILSASGCFASGYMGSLEDAWRQCSIVVLGRPQLSEYSRSAHAREHTTYAGYRVKIEKAYKGAKVDEEIEFLDPNCRTTAGLNITEGSRYLLLIQTKEDRERHDVVNPLDLVTSLTGRKAIKVDDAEFVHIEAAIVFFKAFEGSSPEARKKMLLENLSIDNRYSKNFIDREILLANRTEAIPLIREKLAHAKNMNDRMNLASILRSLGDPKIKDTLHQWLADESINSKWQIIEQLVKMKDASVIPEIRKYINSSDELLAVNARNALLTLGDPGAKMLLLDMVKKSKNEIVRHNAIQHLWGYNGEFTEEEKAIIRGLVNDKDESVARTAGFIVEKWKAKAGK